MRKIKTAVGCVLLSAGASALGVTVTKDITYSTARTVVLEDFGGMVDPASGKNRTTLDSISGGAATYNYAGSESPEGTITYNTTDYNPAVYGSMRIRMAVDRNNSATTPVQVYPYPVGPAGFVTKVISSGTTLNETSYDLSGTSASGSGVRIDAFNYTNDGTQDQFKIDYIMVDQSRTIGYEFDHDADLNQTTGNNISSYSVVNGLLTGTGSGDAQINLKAAGAPDIDGDIYKYVEISMKGNAGDRIDFFWDTATQPGGATRVEAESAGTSDGEYHTYLLDFTDEANWEGNLSFLRLDPVTSSGGSFEVDSVRFMEAIPEPATLGLIAAMGGVALFIRRRFMI